MEELTFTIEDSEIAELLGRQNFTSKESAIFELIKNSYDAGSESCAIYISQNSIKIIDVGIGMNREEIKRHWMHVGKSSKGYKDLVTNRILTGSKGVGRFALARLGNRARVKTKKANHSTVIWETNWTQSSLTTDEDSDLKDGTSIQINDLRDQWRIKDIKNLLSFLNRAYKTDSMKITINYDGNEHKVEPIFKDTLIGKDYVSRIRLKYDSKSQNMLISVESDEFTSKVEEILRSKEYMFHSNSFNLNDEFKDIKNFESPNQINTLLNEVGDFDAELFFILEKTTREHAEKFFYKYNGLQGLETGIVLYRNDFSIASHDGHKDWLDITDRARKSPAAATHPTGSWRVRRNQIFGMINIDKQDNNFLVDLANRQGLDENIHYDMFKQIINFGISRFESYRQTIIRKIDNYNTINSPERKLDNKKLKTFLKKPDEIVKMTPKEISEIAVEIKDMQKEAVQRKKVFKENEEKHKYDVRILNVLSTQGLRSSAIAHELHNKKNILSSGFEDIIEALKEYGYWDELNSEENTKHMYKNVPKILESLQDINFRLISFLDIILNKVEKKKFETKISSIQSVMDNIKFTWEHQYNWLNIDLNIFNEPTDSYDLSEDVLEVIFDNLILNSIQHNEMRQSLNINIEIKCHLNTLNFSYSDDGVGLDKKYQNEPFRILEVHETTRSEGHGLGMWIVNNTLYTYKGNIESINGENGFNITFSLKGRDR